MSTASVIESVSEPRSFQTRYGSRVAIVGGGFLGMTLALRYRQAGRIVTVFEATERVERRGHVSVASRDRALRALLEELDLASSVRWESAGTPGPRFGALVGGRAYIVEKLRDRARAIDVDMRLGTPVHLVDADRSGFVVHAGAETGEFDEVLLTVPSPIASQLLSGLPERERLPLRDVGYFGIITVAFVLAQRLVSRYISRIARGQDSFALICPSALAPEQAANVVYVNRPVAATHALFEASDRQVIEHFARALPGNATIVSARVIRTPHAFAQHRQPTFTNSIAGLAIVNAAHMGAGRHHLDRTAALATNVFRTLCAERIS